MRAGTSRTILPSAPGKFQGRAWQIPGLRLANSGAAPGKFQGCAWQIPELRLANSGAVVETGQMSSAFETGQMSSAETSQM